MDKNRITSKPIMTKYGKTGDIEEVLPAPRKEDEVSYRGSRTRMASNFYTARLFNFEISNINSHTHPNYWSSGAAGVKIFSDMQDLEKMYLPCTFS